MENQIQLDPQAMMNALVQQRNELADKVAMLSAAVETLQKQLKEATADKKEGEGDGG